MAFEKRFGGLASRLWHNSLVVVSSVTSCLVVQYRSLTPQATNRPTKDRVVSLRRPPDGSEGVPVDAPALQGENSLNVLLMSPT